MASDRFSLVVDDFGVKYEGKEHADHLMSVLKEHYTVTEDWEGSKYIGITLDWDYEGRKVHLSLPGYNTKALKRFHHEPPAKRQDSPYPHPPQNTGPSNNTPKAPTIHHHLTKPIKLLSNKSREHSYSADEQLTAHYSLHSPPLTQNKVLQLRTQ